VTNWRCSKGGAHGWTKFKAERRRRMKIAPPTSLFALGLVGLGLTGAISPRGSTPMVLHFLFVLYDLAFQFIKDEIESGVDILASFRCDKVVLVLCRHEEFDNDLSLFGIDQNFDHHDALEKVQELAGFFTNVLLSFLTQMPVAGGNLDLHGHAPYQTVSVRWYSTF
jgi:hypothetical protein